MPRLPPPIASVLAALHLARPRALELSDAAWREALAYADAGRITLYLAALPHPYPAWVRERLDQCFAKNRVRMEGIAELYRSIEALFSGAGLDYVFLKGLTHPALFDLPAANRVQYDIDLYCARPSVFAARDLLAASGFQPIDGLEDFPTGHLPPMVRPHHWKWRGDFFDPDIPIAVEPHFRFWDGDVERLPVPDAGEFWTRRTTRPVGRLELPVLSPHDALGFAALHLLKHVLRGSAHPAHVYEIARILDSLAADDRFWHEWQSLHSPELRRLEAIACHFAASWFGCRAAPALQEEIERLPAGAQAWFADFAFSPARGDNKDHLWLHLSLLPSRVDRLAIARLRLLPGNLPPRGASGGTPYQTLGSYVLYTAGRFRHHALALPRTALSGARWWWRANPLGPQFWVFLCAAAVFNFALFIFVLLYNLFLIELGFRDDFLGVVNGAARAGSAVATLPAAFVAHRLGLRRALVWSIASLALVEFLRAMIGARLPLAALAFASGSIFAVWAVILAPSIAATVPGERRPTAFSIFFASMFAIGIAGNWIGGALPLWMGGKRPVLLLSAAMSALAVLPALAFRPAAVKAAGERIYPRGRFLLLFLVPFAFWHLATGAFNPFNNRYFERLGFSVPRIGGVFAASQFAQVATVLLAPLVIRRLGLLGGIVAMMFATALSLAALAAEPSGWAAASAYMAYMSAQWMSEPGLNTLLMNHVSERERSGASAVAFLVAFGAQALAAYSAGAGFERFGWPAVLTVAAFLGAGSAALFRIMLAPLLRARLKAASESVPE